MKTGKILRRIVMLISLLMLITSTIGTTYGYIVTKTDPITNVFVPGASSVSGLTISKTVEHPLGEAYAIPDNISFDFKIELGSYYAKAKLNTTLGELTADENGVLIASIKPDVVFGIEGLEKGTVVNVTEKKTNLDGFAVKGEATKTITVGVDGTASISFVNTYTPEAVKPSNITVSGVKILEGREWQNGDSFAFVLEQKIGESWTKLGEKTVIYDAKDADFNKFNFNEIFQALTFDQVGTYNFRMSEVSGNLEKVDYDKTVNYFTVNVTDVDMDGKLEINKVSGTENIKVSEANGSYVVAVTFNNTFVPPVAEDPDPITVQIGVEKIIYNVGDENHGLGGFQFVLTNTATSEALSATSDDNGKASFSLTFTKADIGKSYTYKLSETNQGFAGMSYDTDVHEITVAISLNKNNELVTALTMDGKNVDALSATFENTYNVETPDASATGDDFNLTLWIILMVVSGSVLVAIVIYERKINRI
ncbi:MAG: hypothetical protein J6J30_05400 [Clostridia bacterium]|nr:hypothetical protein [Clostridia bacterium]